MALSPYALAGSFENAAYEAGELYDNSSFDEEYCLDEINAAIKAFGNDTLHEIKFICDCETDLFEYSFLSHGMGYSNHGFARIEDCLSAGLAHFLRIHPEWSEE